MKVTTRTWGLLGLATAIGAFGMAGLHFGLRPKRTPIAFASPPPQPKRIPPTKELHPPASQEVESLTLSTVDTKALPPSLRAPEGLMTAVVAVTKPFEITKRYRSMEGPYANIRFRLDGGKPRARELWWWKGAVIEVIDAEGKSLGPEFMCHLNIDIDPDVHDKAVELATGTRRVLTMTQGEMAFALPKGRGFPVASDEEWSFMFQVLNRNRDSAPPVRQRLTLYFERDADLFAPIDPVNAHAASIWIPVDRSSPESAAADKELCHCCAPLERGLEASNNVAGGARIDSHGRMFVGHWVVPPGKSTWTYPVFREMNLDSKRQIFATWSHVHPFATSLRLIEHKPGCDPRPIIQNSIESETDGKIGLKRIRSFVGNDGESLSTDAAYELAIDYDNTSGVPQDSMASLGAFVDASPWKRPTWAARAQNLSDMDASCGLEAPVN